MANIYGCDISHHQTEKAVREIVAGGKADFIITRAGIGSYTEDKKFDIFEADLKTSGLKNSYYLASYAASREDAEAEADFLVSVIGEKDNKPELAIFFDWEYFSANYIKEEFGIDTTPQLVQGVTEAFCERIKMHGFTAGVYLNKDYWDRFYTDFFFTQHPDYKIWYARPGYSKPDKPCDIWQYGSDNGADYGYTGGNLDKNILMSAYLEEVEPMKPLSDEPVRMRIGFASSGDLKKLTVKIEGLGISCEEADGYIITDYASRGDQCYILVDANALGIPCEIYNPQPEGDKNPNENKETIDQLQSIISELEKTKLDQEQVIEQLKADIQVAAPYMEKAVKLEMAIVEKDKAFEELKARFDEKEENHKAEIAGMWDVIRGAISDKDCAYEQLAEANKKVEIAAEQMKSNDYFIEQLKTENGVLKEVIKSLEEKAEENEGWLSGVWRKFIDFLKGVFS